MQAGERELVLRVGRHREDFEKELIAATWREPGLAVPDVLEAGEAFDCHYIVSQRHHGTKLADLDPSRVPEAIDGLFEVLASMRRVVLPGKGFGIWNAPDGDAPASTWSEYLCGVADRDESRLVDWRHKLSLQPRAPHSFRLGCTTLQANAGDLPAIRGLVHADLLLNHLVGPNNTITAVFDWGTRWRAIRSTTSRGSRSAFRGSQRSTVNMFSTSPESSFPRTMSTGCFRCTSYTSPSRVSSSWRSLRICQGWKAQPTG